MQGADVEQLTRVKRVAQFAVYTAYRLRLETAFLADECASAAAVAVAADERAAALEPARNSPDRQQSAELPLDAGLVRSALSASASSPDRGTSPRHEGPDGGPPPAPPPAVEAAQRLHRSGSAASMMDSVSVFRLAAPQALSSAASVGSSQAVAAGGDAEHHAGGGGISRVQSANSLHGAGLKRGRPGTAGERCLSACMSQIVCRGRYERRATLKTEFNAEVLSCVSCAGDDETGLFQIAIAEVAASAAATTAARQEGVILSCSPHVSVWRRRLPAADCIANRPAGPAGAAAPATPATQHHQPPSAGATQPDRLDRSPFSSPLRQSLQRQMSQDDPPPLTSRDAVRKLVSTESSASHGVPSPSEAGGAVPRPPASSGRHSRGPSHGGASEGTALDPASSILAELELHQQCSPAEIRGAQRISTSLASRNPTKNLLCQPPTVQSILYYHQSGVLALANPSVIPM